MNGIVLELNHSELCNFLSFLMTGTMLVTITLLVICLNLAETRDLTNLPFWPKQFKWWSAGIPAGYKCTQIIETADPHTWRDNYFCWEAECTDPEIRWSSAGPIAGMRCTHIVETADSHTWNDNYLCVPHWSPYQFRWSSAGPIFGKSCIQWLETADPDTWNDNYLCADGGSGPIW